MDSDTRAYRDVFTACLPTWTGLFQTCGSSNQYNYMVLLWLTGARPVIPWLNLAPRPEGLESGLRPALSMLRPSPTTPRKSPATRSHKQLLLNWNIPSEPLEFRERQAPTMYMHGTEFRAPAQGRHCLARIQQSGGIKDLLNRVKL